ncbi:MAG: hypothetical protein JWM21_197 [Acidobacteria bacterium]|nr:hypothetical protein [Acidobacteriota bacterium]
MDSEINKLLDLLEQTPEIISGQVVSLSEAEVRCRKADDYFSALEDVCHLRDLEVEGYAVRIDRILNEEQPVLGDFDGGRIAIERDYNSQDIRHALDAFTLARKQNVARLRSLTPEQLAREGVLEGVGHVSLKRLLLLMREHDEGHLQTLASS